MSTGYGSLPASAHLAQNVRKGVLFFQGGEFSLQFDKRFMFEHKHEYEMFIGFVKKLRTRTFCTRRLAWTIPVADDAFRTLHQIVGYGIAATSEARQRISTELKRMAEIEGAKQQSEEVVETIEMPTAPDLALALKNYQKFGVKFMAARERAYNADEMGLGKSLQALAALEYANAYPAVIVCPPKLRQNWKAECRKWLPGRTAALNVNSMADITILAYTELHKFVNYKLGSPKIKERREAKEDPKNYFFPRIRKPVAIAADEGHQIKNLTSIRTQAVLALAQQADARYRFVLSGTPIENAPKEMIAPMTFLGVLEKMGGWNGFTKRYCAATKQKVGTKVNDKGEVVDKVANNINGASNGKEMYERMCKLFYIRRKKSVVAKDLPDKLETVVEAEIDNELEYRRIEQDVKAVLIEQSGKLLSEGQQQAIAMMRMGLLRSAAGRGKAKWIAEWTDTFLENGEKFVLYANSPEVQKVLVKELARWNPAVVLGGCKDVKREEDKFMKDPSCRLFIGSTLAAGFGLTLTVASHIGIAELMWTHSKHQQVADRVHRIGQKNCVNVYYFIAPGTIDEDIWQIVSDKQQIVAASADGETVAQNLVLTNLLRKYQDVAA